MIGAAHVPDDSPGKIAIEAIKCSVQLDRLRVVTVHEQSATGDVHVFGKNPNWSKNLWVWGKAGVVKEGPSGKNGDCGVEMMFASYSDCESDSVDMWDPATNGIVTTCNVIWMKCMFYEHPIEYYIDVDPVEAKDADVIGTNDNSYDASTQDDDQSQTLQVHWADIVKSSTSLEPTAGEAVIPTAMVTRYG